MTELKMGSVERVRFLEEAAKHVMDDSWCVDLRRQKRDRCMDCEARSYISTLEDLDLDSPDCFERLRDALLWVLENTDWPTR